MSATSGCSTVRMLWAVHLADITVVESVVTHDMLRNSKVPEVAREAMYRLVIGTDDVPYELLKDGFRAIFAVSDKRIRASLCATMSTTVVMRGPRVDEVMALVDVLVELDGLTRERPRLKGTEAKPIVTVMGSGKKGFRSLNISTPSALLASAAGAAVAKVGANCTSRITSSIEFIRAAGVNVDLKIDSMDQVLQETGFGYFTGGEAMAPGFFDTYKGTCIAPHALMFGWPLLSPVETDAILYGLSHPKVDVASEILYRLGAPNAHVVATDSGHRTMFDECLPLGTTSWCSTDGTTVSHTEHDFATELQCEQHDLEGIAAHANPEDDITLTLYVLRGAGSSVYHDTVALNAAAILKVSGICETIDDGFVRCSEVLREGGAFEKLIDVIRATGGDPLVLNTYT